MIEGAGFNQNLQYTNVILGSTELAQLIGRDLVLQFTDIPALSCNTLASNFYYVDVASDAGADAGTERRYFVDLGETDAKGVAILHNIGCVELIHAMNLQLGQASPLSLTNPHYRFDDAFDVSCFQGRKPGDIPTLTIAQGPQSQIAARNSPVLGVEFKLTPPDDAATLVRVGDDTCLGFLKVSGLAVSGKQDAHFVDQHCHVSYAAKGLDYQTDPVELDFDFSCKVGTPTDCGTCNNACPGASNASAACTNFACGIQCNDGFGDCDGKPENGCEAPLDTVDHCGGCGTVASPTSCNGGLNSSPVCSAATSSSQPPSYSCGTTCNAGWGHVSAPSPHDCEHLLATQISAGASTTCAVLGDSSVACWGLNGNGQIGNGSAPSTKPYVATPVQVTRSTGEILTGAKKVAVNFDGACALMMDGTVNCWGFNWDGEVGSGVVSPNVLNPVRVVGLAGVTDIALGGFHACALMGSGTVECWGANNYGQLGDGTTSSQSVPVAAAAKVLTNVVQVVAGLGHTCALKGDGEVLCWGDDTDGEIGDGSKGGQKPPTNVTFLHGATAKQLTVGLHHTCALLGDGTVQCWGNNTLGQVGDGTAGTVGANYRTSPVDVVGLTGLKQLVAGGDTTCAITDAAVQCWGDNGADQLGNNATPRGYASAPVTVTSLGTGTKQFSIGQVHSCLLGFDSTVRCWGYNTRGQLGIGTTSFVLVPLPTPAASLPTVHL